MADKDITRLAVEKALHTIALIRAKLLEKIPYGPMKERMTPAEARRHYQNMEPELKQQVMANMGPEQWEQLMERLYS